MQRSTAIWCSLCALIGSFPLIFRYNKGAKSKQKLSCQFRQGRGKVNSKNINLVPIENLESRIPWNIYLSQDVVNIIIILQIEHSQSQQLKIVISSVTKVWHLRHERHFNFNPKLTILHIFKVCALARLFWGLRFEVWRKSYPIKELGNPKKKFTCIVYKKRYRNCEIYK